MTTSNCQGFSTKLGEILESDDEARFVNLFRDHPTNLDTINSLVNECVELLASRCLMALIRGEVCNTHPTFDAGKLPNSGVSALAYIAHCCPEDSQAINLILTKCGGTCLANVYCTIGVVHGLPLHFLLINLSLIDHLYLWYRGTPITRLVLLLCLWETKPILDSLRVLVKHTDSINTIAWIMLSNGGLKQFAALLLIAREKVIAPFGDTGLAIDHYITREINLIPEDNLSLDQVEYKCILRDAQTLLSLFELAGDDLSSYCSSMQKYVSADDVVDDVCGLLIKNGVVMCNFDILLSASSVKGYQARAISDSEDINPLMRMDLYEAKLRPKAAVDKTSAYSRFYEASGKASGKGVYWERRLLLLSVKVVVGKGWGQGWRRERVGSRALSGKGGVEGVVGKGWGQGWRRGEGGAGSVGVRVG
ncbi:hypothetical protein KSS87_007242 [Heliosperma pusillum]|nr:hypothetical protein KSS87_007242 [Heliosperma pusillum]